MSFFDHPTGGALQTIHTCSTTLIMILDESAPKYCDSIVSGDTWTFLFLVTIVSHAENKMKSKTFNVELTPVRVGIEDGNPDGI